MILRKKSKNGFTLIEVIVVMTIVGILSMMIVSACIEYINKARERVCEANRLQVERIYDTCLIIENTEHSEIGFNEFLVQYGEVPCPSEGHITYDEGKVMCDRHERIEEKEDTEEVPIL